MSEFDDLLANNRAYAEGFAQPGLEGRAAAGVAVVTCIDSRMDPLSILGLGLGDAAVFRNPGARVTSDALETLVLGVHLLGVERILVIPHTRCAVASASADQVRERVTGSAGVDSSWQSFHVVDDQRAELRSGLAKIRSHPLIPDTVAVAGFLYDVDTGLLTELA